MRQYVEIRGAVPRPAMFKLFCRVMGQASLADRIALYCVFIVTLGAFFNFAIFAAQNQPVQYFASILVSIAVFVWLLWTYLKIKEAAFSRIYKDLQFEISHFSVEREFFYYLLFLEKVESKGLYSRQSIEKCLRYLKIELKDNGPSTLGSDPLLLFLIAVWAGVIVAFLDSSPTKVIALLFIILFVVSLIGLQVAGAKRSSRKFLSRLEKYCQWALEMSDEEMRIMKKSLIRSRRLSRRQKPFMWSFRGHPDRS